MKVVKRQLNHRRARLASLVGIGVIVAALVFAAAAGRGSASDNSLKLTVVATNKGPLTTCSPDCSVPKSAVRYFLYVDNKRPLLTGAGTRATQAGAFVMRSVDWTYSVDGVAYGPAGPTLIAPPNIVETSTTTGRAWSGTWPSTVTCPGTPPWFTDSTDPCNIVEPPAIIPGEKTVAFHIGWGHGVGEPNGTYVFRFTIHGTLDGQPVDLTADSPSIVMTD
jgi:hypothetical protein